MAEQATLYNPQTGHRAKVEVGGSDAQRLFGDNYVLEESYDANTGVSTYTGMDGPTVNDVPAEEAEINIADGADLATGGYKDTFYEDAAKTYNASTSDISKFKMETIASMDRQNEANKIKEQESADASAKGLDEWTRYDADAAIEEFKDKINYQDTLDKLNAIEMESADAWKNYTDLKNSTSRQTTFNSIITGELGKHKEDYLAEATYLAMRTDIVQGNLNRIDKRVYRYYDQVNQMQSQMISNFETALAMSKNRVFQLEDKEESYILETLNVLEAKQEKETAERDAKRNLWQFAMQNNVDVASLGLTMQDDYDTMMRKISPAIEAKHDAEFQALHNGNATGDGTGGYPTNVTSYTDRLAYDSAKEIYKLEGKGFNDADWKRHVQNFIDKTKGDYSETEASRLLANGLTAYKDFLKVDQLVKQPEEPTPEDPDVATFEAPEGVSTSTWYQNVGDYVTGGGTYGTSKDKEYLHAQGTVDNAQSKVDTYNTQISDMESQGNLNAGDKRLLKNIKSKLKQEKAKLAAGKRNVENIKRRKGIK